MSQIMSQVPHHIYIYTCSSCPIDSYVHDLRIVSYPDCKPIVKFIQIYSRHAPTDGTLIFLSLNKHYKLNITKVIEQLAERRVSYIRVKPEEVSYDPATMEIHACVKPALFPDNPDEKACAPEKP